MNFDNENKYHLFDQYLGGDMNSEDIDKFKAFMQSDADLALDLKILTEINEANTFSNSETQLRATLGQIRRESSPAPAKNMVTRYILFALLMGLLLFSCFYFFLGNNIVPEKTLHQQFALIEPLQLTTKSGSQVTDLKLLQEHYNTGKYEAALPLIDRYLSKNPRDMDVLLAKGIALMETGDYDRAHHMFRSMSMLSPRVKKYRWYQALLYMKKGEIGDTKRVLNDIINSKTYNYEKAKKLLGKL